MSSPRGTGPDSGQHSSTFLGFGPGNLLILALGVAAIVAGYVLLGRGSITAAPLLLMLGYAVLIPAALLIGFRRLKR